MSDAADAREDAESISEALCGDGSVSGFDMAEMERWASIRDLSCHESSQLPSEILAELESWAANAPKTRPLPFLVVGHDLRWFMIWDDFSVALRLLTNNRDRCDRPYGE
jgi:hypothetical protein